MCSQERAYIGDIEILPLLRVHVTEFWAIFFHKFTYFALQILSLLNKFFLGGLRDKTESQDMGAKVIQVYHTSISGNNSNVSKERAPKQVKSSLR